MKLKIESLMKYIIDLLCTDTYVICYYSIIAKNLE